MKMIKMITAMILIGALMVCASACSGGSKSEETSEEQPAEAVSGGWELNNQSKAAELPEEVQKAFDKATEEMTGSTLEPAAYVGEQVVAGKNYMILCKATSATEKPDTSYQMAVIYADLNGDAELTSQIDFNIADYTEGEGTQKTEIMMGSWYVPDDACGSGVPDDVSAAFDKAAEGADWSWSKVAPLAYLGSQVVAGTNYSLLCRGETKGNDPACMLVVTVYEDLDGNAEITNVYGLDLSKFSGQ